MAWPARSDHPGRPAALGIGMVHQHFTVDPGADRGGKRGPGGRLERSPRDRCARTRALSERVGLPLDPDQRAGRLSVASSSGSRS